MDRRTGCRVSDESTLVILRREQPDLAGRGATRVQVEGYQNGSGHSLSFT